MAELTRVEYVMPGAEHPAAEEEQRRKSADLLIKNWMELQNERVQNDSSREIQPLGTLPDESKPP
jgi:hypothetical protein